jgi:hypothetical protein
VFFRFKKIVTDLFFNRQKMNFFEYFFQSVENIKKIFERQLVPFLGIQTAKSPDDGKNLQKTSATTEDLEDFYEIFVV